MEDAIRWGGIAAEYRCCLAVSNDLRDGVQAVLGRVRRLPHPDQRVNAGGVQRVFTVDYARPAQAQHGVGFVNGDELFAQIGEVCVDERIAHRLLAADVLVDAGGRHIGLCGQRTDGQTVHTVPFHDPPCRVKDSPVDFKGGRAFGSGLRLRHIRYSRVRTGHYRRFGMATITTTAAISAIVMAARQANRHPHRKHRPITQSGPTTIKGRRA